jgi:hypothetical protein
MSQSKSSSTKSMQDLGELLRLFKDSIIRFIDELIEIMPSEEDLVHMRIFLSIHVGTEQLMNQFCKFVLPHKKLIESRNDAFFIERDDLFGTIEQGKVIHCKKIWCSGQLDEENKNVIWKWFDHFMKLATDYSERRKKIV